MYIGSGFIVVIILIALYFYAMSKERHKEETEKIEKLEKEKENEAQKEREDARIEKENNINFITSTLNIEKDIAKEFYEKLILDNKFNNFKYCENKRTQNKLYKEFAKEKEEKQKFIDLVYPICQNENLNLNLEFLWWNKEDYFDRYKDFNLVDKLKMINNEQENENFLLNLLKPYYPNFERNTKVSIVEELPKYSYKNSLLYDDVFNIVEIISNTFDFSIDISKIRFRQHYFFIDHIEQEDWYIILRNLFVICLYESDTISNDARFDKNNSYDFYWYCSYLFFSLVYYDIKDCKQIALSYIDEYQNS